MLGPCPARCRRIATSRVSESEEWWNNVIPPFWNSVIPAFSLSLAAGAFGKGRKEKCLKYSFHEFGGSGIPSFPLSSLMQSEAGMEKAGKGKCLNYPCHEISDSGIPEFPLSTPPLSLTTNLRKCCSIRDSTSSERSRPSIAACTDRRLELSTERWIVALTLAAAERPDALAAGRFRPFPLTGSDDSGGMAIFPLSLLADDRRSVSDVFGYRVAMP